MLLDDIQLAPRRARTTDPVTSHEAAARVGEFASDHATRVLDALKRAGGKAGAEQIAWLAGMDGYQASKRLPECERAGLVRRTDETAMTRSGRKETVWELVA